MTGIHRSDNYVKHLFGSASSLLQGQRFDRNDSKQVSEEKANSKNVAENILPELPERANAPPHQRQIDVINRANREDMKKNNFLLTCWRKKIQQIKVPRSQGERNQKPRGLKE